ncbi:MAG: acyltransferase [Bacteroidetes bacterium HGW-Bacteroidetes-2]|jgi:acetyltransferase-like isoleucine patch superfamily enzyme|nr:MAG: acyltransferase [Bacteroidetes bacterium HGW-Bacteroidetes-2]
MSNPRDKFYKYKKVIIFFVKMNSFLPKSINNKLLIWFRGQSGLIGVAIRYVLIKNLARKCGDNVAILEHVFFDAIHLMEFGNNVSINPYCYIAGEIKFGNDIAVANHTSFHSFNHTYSDKNMPIKNQPTVNDPIVVDDDVWFGSGCRILSGVKIGSRVVVAAGAVVSKSIPTKTIVGGVPAKVIKNI